MKRWLALIGVLGILLCAWWYGLTASRVGVTTAPSMSTATSAQPVPVERTTGSRHPAIAPAAAGLPATSPARPGGQGRAGASDSLQEAFRLLACADVHLAELQLNIDVNLHNIERLNELLRGKGADDPEFSGLADARLATASRVEEDRRALAACESLPEAERRSGLALLQRAAETGISGARIAYARNAFSEYTSPEALVANLDEVVRRRDLVRHFLAQSLAQCEPDIWAVRFDLRDVLAGSRDPAAQVAIIQAYYRSELARGEEAAHLQHVRDTLDTAGQSLDAAARDGAMRQGDAAVARCAAVSH